MSQLRWQVKQPAVMRTMFVICLVVSSIGQPGGRADGLICQLPQDGQSATFDYDYTGDVYRTVVNRVHPKSPFGVVTSNWTIERKDGEGTLLEQGEVTFTLRDN